MSSGRLGYSPQLCSMTRARLRSVILARGGCSSISPLTCPEVQVSCAHIGEFVISKSKARPLASRLRRHCLVMNEYMLARLQSADNHCAHLRLIAHVQKSIRSFPHDCATLRRSCGRHGQGGDQRGGGQQAGHRVLSVFNRATLASAAASGVRTRLNDARQANTR
jgi:hypothetical protein